MCVLMCFEAKKNQQKLLSCWFL